MKVKEDKLCTKKIFLDKIRREWSLCIFILNLDTISVLVTTVFYPQIFRSPLPGRSLTLYSSLQMILALPYSISFYCRLSNQINICTYVILVNSFRTKYLVIQLSSSLCNDCTMSKSNFASMRKSLLCEASCSLTEMYHRASSRGMLLCKGCFRARVTCSANGLHIADTVDLR